MLDSSVRVFNVSTLDLQFLWLGFSLMRIHSWRSGWHIEQGTNLVPLQAVQTEEGWGINHDEDCGKFVLDFRIWVYRCILLHLYWGRLWFICFYTLWAGIWSIELNVYFPYSHCGRIIWQYLFVVRLLANWRHITLYTRGKSSLHFTEPSSKRVFRESRQLE